MSQETIEAAEARLLSGIIALVLDEQPGQGAAALAALRRRAAASRVSAGALKNVFDRLTTQTPPAPPPATVAEVQRLQSDLAVAEVQTSRLTAEVASLRHRLAQAERTLSWHAGNRPDRRVLAAMPGPQLRPLFQSGLLAGALLALLGLALHGDRPAPPAPARIATVAR